MGEIQKNDKQLSMDFSAESVGSTEKEEKKEVTAITTELEKAEVPVFGNAGITYRLVIMDGDDVEKVKVVDENAYNKFEKGKDYILTGQVNVNNARCGEWKVNGFVKL